MIAIVALGLSAAVSLRGDGTLQTNGTVFLQTGGGSTLVRTNRSWSAPAALTHPALVFTFGFATDEVLAPGDFADSFTVTIRNGDRTFVAPALTADLFGITPAPENPDGTQFTTNDVQAEALPFPALGPSLRLQQAFLVLVVLPPALAGQTGTVSATLFDNLNSQRSIAFISNPAIVPGPGSLLALESAASVNGPYAPEDGIFVRHARRCLTLAQPSPHRFYRLRAGTQTQITRMTGAGDDWVFSFSTAGAVPPILESSAQVAGPFATENGTRADMTGRTMRVPKDGVARFFRIRSEIPLVIHGMTREGGRLVLNYE